METIQRPALRNTSLLSYVQGVEARYPEGEFYKEELRDTGRGEGPSLGITVCGNGEVLEEENFYYASYQDLLDDLEDLAYYLDFD
jgi:hypothetical protein